MTLTWSKNCVLTDMKTATEEDVSVFIYIDTILYLPEVTLSAKDDIRLLEELKTGFKTTVKWNKYISEMTNQTKSYDLNYLIDPNI